MQEFAHRAHERGGGTKLQNNISLNSFVKFFNQKVSYCDMCQKLLYLLAAPAVGKNSQIVFVCPTLNAFKLPFKGVGL